MQNQHDVNMHTNTSGLPDPVTMGECEPRFASMSMTTADECSSGFQSASISNFPSTLPSSASTTINEFPPQQPPPCVLPSPPFDMAPEMVIEELGQYISNENDKVVLTSSVGVLFSYSINNVRGPEVCQLMSASPVILNALYNLLTSEEFKDDDPILFLATGNLTNISKYEAGRSAILGFNELPASDWPSRGIKSLINSLRSRDSNVVIFAITAIHNLLLDRRTEVQDIAKKQIHNAGGITYIVEQLNHQYLMNTYEFKVIVLDCLLKLAYNNSDNKRIILQSDGPRLLLKTIMDNFDNQPTEESLEIACKVLKSLSCCPDNKVEILRHEGIEILTKCIGRDTICDDVSRKEILKTCLWTLRNLSDVINNHFREQGKGSCVHLLVERLLGFLYLFEYSEESCIIKCALGILANLTCNNEPIKQFICDKNGVELLSNIICNALADSRNQKVTNNEILEPAILALYHLLNQVNHPMESEKQYVRGRFAYNPDFWTVKRASTSVELSKVVDRLTSLLQLQMGFHLR